jgi:hypothetical protein
LLPLQQAQGGQQTDAPAIGGGRRLFEMLPSRVELEIVRVIDTGVRAGTLRALENRPRALRLWRGGGRGVTAARPRHLPGPALRRALVVRPDEIDCSARNGHRLVSGLSQMAAP